MVRRSLFYLAAILCIGLVGCGKDKSPGEKAPADEAPAIASQLPPADVTSKKGDAQIEPSVEQYPVAGLFLNPYFDEAGKKTELAVKAGEQFKFYVFGETVEPYSTNAIQYRLSLPAGVDMMGASEFQAKTVSAGDPMINYMLAYDCQPPGRFRLVTYVCYATPAFKGGEIRVLEGLPVNGLDFVGFVSCDFVEVRCTGGAATLRLK